jgi:predicted DNA-binding protein (MmcQ/YjbR family)
VAGAGAERDVNHWAEALCATCRAMPHCTEKQPWGEGETAFQIGGRTFAFVSYANDRCAVSAKPEAGERDAFLALPGFAPAPYVGRFGWLCLEVGDEADMARAELLIRQSYGLFAGGRRRRIGPA